MVKHPLCRTRTNTQDSIQPMRQVTRRQRLSRQDKVIRQTAALLPWMREARRIKLPRSAAGRISQAPPATNRSRKNAIWKAAEQPRKKIFPRARKTRPAISEQQRRPVEKTAGFPKAQQ